MKNKFLNALVVALLLFQSVAPISALAYVSTDQADYAPGSVVTISGDNSDVSETNPGFTPSEPIHVDVAGPNGYTALCNATADDYGAWSCQVTLWDSPDAVGSYNYTATGQTSGVSQSGTFTDATPTRIRDTTMSPSTGACASNITASATLEYKISNPNNFGALVGKTVNFTLGSSTGSGTTDSNGVATASLTVPSGATSLVTSFAGDATYNAVSQSITFSVTGSCAVATTTSISAPAITYDANGTVTVTVSSGSGTPTGNVSLSVDGGLAVSKALSGGSATFTNTDVAALGSPNAGDHTLSAIYAAQGSFGGSSATGTLHVHKATPTLSVTNSPVTYDGNSHSAAVTSSVAGSVSNILTGGAASQVNAGVYVVTADFAPTDTTNYNSLTEASAGNFFIGKATPTLSVINSPATYSGAAQAAAVSGSVTGIVSNVKYNGSTTVPTNANTYTITADFAPSDTTNYSNLTGASAGNFVINQVAVIVTAGSGSGTYNGFAQLPSDCVVTGDYTGDLTCTNNPASVGPDADTYAISPVVSGTGLDNFVIMLVDGSYTIKQASLSITADSDVSTAAVDGFSKTYDGLVYTGFTVRYDGFVNGESSVFLGGTLSFSGAATTAVNAGGPYTVTPGGLTSSNYAITFTNGSLTINQAPLTITANDKTVSEGSAWPTFTVSYDGFVNSENSNVLGGILVCTSTAPNPTTDNGTFQINCSGLTSGNYNITDLPGTLTVTNVAPSVSALTIGSGTGTACVAGNVVTLNFGFTDPGVNDNPWHVVIDWGDGNQTIYDTATQGAQPQQSHTYGVGSFTITVTVTDKDHVAGSNSSAAGAVAHLYNMSGILAPFNPDGTSVWKYGSTLPVKVKITDCNSTPVPGLAPKIGTSLVSSTDPNVSIDESASTSAADTTGIMRYDATAGQYIYNFASKYLSDPSATYYMTVKGTDANGNIITTPGMVQVKFGLKTK